MGSAAKTMASIKNLDTLIQYGTFEEPGKLVQLFPFKELFVQKVENLVQVACDSVVTGQLFHVFSSLILEGQRLIISVPRIDLAVFLGLPLSELPL